MDEFLVNEEAVGHLLRFLSLSDWAVLSVTSQTLRDTIGSLMSTSWFHQHVHHILSRCSTPHQRQNQCRRLVLLVNSFNFPLLIRLQYFTQITRQIGSFPVDVDSIAVTMDPSNWAGTMLQSFMDGCQVDEYRQAFLYVGNQTSIIQSLELFASSEAGADGSEESKINENFLRTNVRQLFLDPCPSGRHKATWLGAIADYVGTKPFARLIILLYGPTNLQGDLDWNFSLEARPSRRHANVYFSLAETLALLPFIPNWSRSYSTRILVHMSNYPVNWSLRSFASLLLPLSYLNIDLVVDYFALLHNTNRDSTAAIIMALTLVLSRDFDNQQISNGMQHGADLILRIIANIIDDPRFCRQKSVVWQQLWDAVRNVAADFAQTAADLGRDGDEAAEDFHNLMNAWKEVAILQIRSQSIQSSY